MPTIQNEATRPPFFVSGKYLRGDALLTMLNSKTPIPEIYETAQSMHGSDENGYLKDDSGKIIAFDDGIDWKFFGTKDPQPTGARVTNYSYSRDQDRYENHPGIRAGSYTTPDFYETVTNDEDLPGGIKQYRPAHGDYVVTTYTTLSGSRETEVFTDVTSTMQITQNDEAGIIWEDLVITTNRYGIEIQNAQGCGKEAHFDQRTDSRRESHTIVAIQSGRGEALLEAGRNERHGRPVS